MTIKAAKDGLPLVRLKQWIQSLLRCDYANHSNESSSTVLSSAAGLLCYTKRF